MIDMPPLQFAQTNGIRMGYYGRRSQGRYAAAGALSRLAGAGVFLASPDQGVERGRHPGDRAGPTRLGSTDRPEPVEVYDIEQLTGDLTGLLDHLNIEKAIFVGHDWGGFVVWQMPLRHIDRVAGVVGINTPHMVRAPIDPIEIFRSGSAT